MEAYFKLGLAFVLLILGYFFGSRREASHLKDIRRREKDLADLPIYAIGKKADVSEWSDSTIVMGSVVVGQDYFKRFLAALKNFFGGRVSSYETLLDRARREATLRLKEQARNWDAKAIANFRMETSTIASNRGRNSSGAVEIMVYATALK